MLSHEREEKIPLEDQMVEYLLMGMRRREGVAHDRLLRFGPAAEAVTGRAQALAEMGLVETGPARLAATRRGRLLLDRVVAELLAD